MQNNIALAWSLNRLHSTYNGANPQLGQTVVTQRKAKKPTILTFVEREEKKIKKKNGESLGDFVLVLLYYNHTYLRIRGQTHFDSLMCVQIIHV